MELFDQDFDDLEPRVVPARVGGRLYGVHEASADAAAKWKRETVRGATRHEDGRVTGLDGAAAAETYLVSLCLYELEPVKEGDVPSARDGPNRSRAVHERGDRGRPVVGWLRLDANGNPDGRWQVNQTKVKGWPARVQTALYDAAIELADLREKGTAERRELVELLSRDDAPCTLAALREYCSTQPAEKYRRLATWLRDDGKPADRNGASPDPKGATPSTTAASA